MEVKFESNEICIWEFIYGTIEGWGKKIGLKLWEQPSNLLLGLEASSQSFVDQPLGPPGICPLSCSLSAQETVCVPLQSSP